MSLVSTITLKAWLISSCCCCPGRAIAPQTISVSPPREALLLLLRRAFRSPENQMAIWSLKISGWLGLKFTPCSSYFSAFLTASSKARGLSLWRNASCCF